MAVTATQLPIHPLDADAYDAIIASGALDDQRVELLDGVLVEMSPQSERHEIAIELLTKHLAAAAARLRVQLSLRVAGDSVPEPDLALVEEPVTVAHRPTSALLVVEVAHTSLSIDRGRKAELYAAAGVPTYWVVDLDNRVVEVRTDPGTSGYRTLATFSPGDAVPSPGAGVDPLDVAALFSGL